MKPLGALPLVALAIVPAGCSLLPSPKPTPGPKPTPTPLQRAERAHELPTPQPRQTVSVAATSPVVAVEAFATAYINWRADNVSARMRALASLSVGQARSELSFAAAQAGHDYELRNGEIANSGTVRAVAPVLGAAGQYAVVTLERTTASNTNAYQGLQPAWHLALATVKRQPGGGWAVSVWQPES
jgi:hypothetical protein